MMKIDSIIVVDVVVKAQWVGSDGKEKSTAFFYKNKISIKSLV